MNDQVRKILLECSSDELAGYVNACELPKIKVPKVRYTSDIEVFEEWETIDMLIEVEYKTNEGGSYKNNLRKGFVFVSKQHEYGEMDIFKAENVGYLYFVFLDGLTKIGKATDIDRRIKQLANGGHSLDVVFVVHVPYYDKWERFFHKLFDEKRISGEWFHLTQTDIDLAKALLLKLDPKV